MSFADSLREMKSEERAQPDLRSIIDEISSGAIQGITYSAKKAAEEGKQSISGCLAYEPAWDPGHDYTYIDEPSKDRGDRQRFILVDRYKVDKNQSQKCSFAYQQLVMWKTIDEASEFAQYPKFQQDDIDYLCACVRNGIQELGFTQYSVSVKQQEFFLRKDVRKSVVFSTRNAIEGSGSGHYKLKRIGTASLLHISVAW